MAERNDEYDVIVVGGGPGGSATAAFLAKDGYRVLLVDKESFPRDKPCGDAISGKSATVLREMGIADEVEEVPHQVALGVLFSSPKQETVQIPFPKNVDPTGIKNSKKYNYVTPGYVIARETFDNVVFQHAKSQKTVDTRENFTVKDLLWEGGRVVGITGKNADGAVEEHRARFVVGADGALSVVAQKTGAFDRDEDHWIGAFRVYYDGIEGMADDIEIHFVDDLIPGYFWIFPMANGRANVGAGMLERDLKGKSRREKIELRKVTEKLIREHPMFKDRFKNAKEVDGSFRGWLLPAGSKHRKIAGDGWLLVGDAAQLIDPFSGEGIGNAMVSGRLAAERIHEIITGGMDPVAVNLAPYEERVRKELDRELQMSYKLQKIGRITPLLNFVIHRASTSESVRTLISQMLADREKKEDFGNALFYLKLALK